MIRVRIPVGDPDGLLAGFGALAVLRLESSATEAGTYAEIDTETIVAGAYLYTLWDDDGDQTTWYRWRASNATPAAPADYSEYAAPFQGQDVNALHAVSYATLDQLLNTYGQRTVDGRKLGRYADLLEAATAQLTDEISIDFFRHPEPSGTEVRYLDGNGRDRLCVHEGIRTAEGGTLALSWDGGASYTDLLETDWYLEPANPQPGYPYDHIRLAPAGVGSYHTFPGGRRRVKATLAFGWPRVPATAREAVLERARQLIAADPSGSGGPVGPEELGQMVGPIRMPDPLYRLVRHWQTQFWCHI